MTLTTEQAKMVDETIGNGNEWPQMTNDPVVNHAVDCIMLGNPDLPYDPDLYEREILAWHSASLTIC